MSDENNIRRIAIHEAGHAVIAWAMGVKVHKIELADGDEPLVGYDGALHPEIAGWVINSCSIDVRGDFYKPITDGDLAAFTYYKACIENELAVSFAGVAAESIYTGKDIDSLLISGGKSDNKNIDSLLSVLKKMGMNDAEISTVRTKALNKTIELVNHYQWEITGIAMILSKWEIIWADEFYSYMTLFTKRKLCPDR